MAIPAEISGPLEAAIAARDEATKQADLEQAAALAQQEAINEAKAAKDKSDAADMDLETKRAELEAAITEYFKAPSPPL